MKKTFYLPLIAVLFLAVVLSSCDVNEKVKVNHFATNIFENGYLRATIPAYASKPALFIELNFRADGRDAYSAFENDNTRRETFERLANEMGDIHHSETYVYFPLVSSPADRTFLYHPVDNIRIYSSIPWSEDEPEGSDITKEFAFLSLNSDKYVLTGQKDDGQGMDQNLSIVGLAQITGLLRKYAADTKYSSVLYDYLDKIDFRSMTFVSDVYADYYGYVSSNNPKFLEPQTLTLEFTYRDGRTTSTEVVIP